VPGVGHGAGEAVEFRYHQGVAGADRGEGLAEAAADYCSGFLNRWNGAGRVQFGDLAQPTVAGRRQWGWRCAMARLLVVDDEQDMLDLLAQRMVQAGHQVVTAGSAVVALALVEQHGMPDAVILDVDMPDTDGFSLLEQLRHRRPGLRVLFVTVLWDGQTSARIRAAGAGLLAKPFTAAQLSAGVQDMLASDTVPEIGR
jgi:CheY-like chemotaxis protein